MADSRFRQMVFALCSAIALPGYKCVCERDGRDPQASTDAACGEVIDGAEAALAFLREPSDAMWQAWRSVNCKTDGEFTCFSGDWGNWLACHHAMIDAADDRSPSLPETPEANARE